MRRADKNTPKERPELDENKQLVATDGDHHKCPGPWHAVTAYLTRNSPELRELNALREQVSNPSEATSWSL